MFGTTRDTATRQARKDVFRELVSKLNRFVLPNEIKIGQCIGRGGFADVHVADMCFAGTNRTDKVAVKKFQVTLRSEEAFAKAWRLLFVHDGRIIDGELIQTFKREFIIWKKLEHENILPLLGITVIDGISCTVSEWMENGTMDAYLDAHAGADVLELVRN
jgi:serine/threonine protein kinase